MTARLQNSELRTQNLRLRPLRTVGPTDLVTHNEKFTVTVSRKKD